MEKGIEIIAGTSLTIDAGSIFKFKDNHYLSITGELNIEGIVGDPVIFTSAYDDSDGTDVYGDGFATATSTIAKKGGVNLHSATSTIENAEFRYLDKATAYHDTYGVQSPINLKNVIYSHNTWSIRADSEDVPITLAENVTFVGAPSTSFITGCSVLDNTLVCD